MTKKKSRLAAVWALVFLCAVLGCGGCLAPGRPEEIRDGGSKPSQGGTAGEAGETRQGDLLYESQTEENPWDEYAFDPHFYPYYGHLTEKQQAVYRQLYYCAVQGISSFIPCEGIRTADLDEVMSAVFNDQPGLFWLDADYEYRHLAGYVTEMILHFNGLEESQENQRRFDEAAEAILSEARLAGTPQEQERLVHDGLLERVRYDAAALHNQSAYSALAGGATVCAGYARAFQYLMTELEIPCYYCVGTSVSYENGREGTVEDHAWNIVRLGDGYYNVDLTWNDTLLEKQGWIYYGYYNRTDRDFLTDHTRGQEAEWLPACDSEEYSFEAIYGVPAELGILETLGLEKEDVVYSLEEYYQRCILKMTEAGVGENTMTLMVAGDGTMAELTEAIDSGAYEQGFLESVVSGLGLNGYSYSLSMTTQQLSGGYYLLIQTNTLR